MLILKLGGSVVTHKDKYMSAHTGNIQRLAMEIAEADTYPIVIVHGGGSFGHPVAKKHGIADGLVDKSQFFGFSETHQAMVKLNQVIVDLLLKAGVPAFAISPSSMIRTDSKRLNELDIGLIKGFIELGLVPVLYGDAVLDSQQTFAILSGDQLIAKLSNNLGADRVIFGSDVDGIFTDNPKLSPDAMLIETVSISSHEANVGATTHTDVTGGMLGKLSEATEAVRGGADVLMVNAFVPGRVRSALRGEKVIGTVLTL
ncbi:isopentenyl phosphate kinase family protein [Candidatus Bathyarchaeota archaeon]|nr:isopentenyl phosphate kinase family protein [Candidatus Bathyarchaeota archaeon]MBT4320215.1 isopentenyl phosphate kinase family protein [Candidatus Bathyarchaeota archaeon]MBT4423384.1 isopentenyl phosphate kinase family protein [Candidatus Bathyarchaeota archaeon]MBT5641666.1 isopentenyl phosphate kinase family protein [Candidatus Bathyarchaeota archaeon]MBT6603960.1 isopentenyl phosphate kinase family protein [Candidatus Bathyarchaeota archaeon]